MRHTPRAVVAAALSAAALLAGACTAGGESAAPSDAAAPPAPEPRPWAIEGPDPRAFRSAGLRAPPVMGAPDLLVQGSGWGHGVGMSQYGAQAQALAGRSHADILAHYYPGTTLQRAPEETEPIRVNLFLNRGDLNRSYLALQTWSVDGGPPDRPVEVSLGDGDPVRLPWARTFRLRVDGETGELVLRDLAGVEHARGAGPARVRYEFTEGNKTLLRMPQFIAPRSRERLQGTFAWGELLIYGTSGLQPVMVLPLERYLLGIAEVPSRWEPAALAAQAVTARTYAVRQMRQSLGATCRCHLGATPHHQVYVGYLKEGVPLGARWREAVERSAGEVVMYQGQLAWTFYSSSHGGRSEHSEDSWAYAQAIPYLRSVDDPWSLDPEVGNPYASWTRRITNAEFAALVGGGLEEVRGVRVLERNAGHSPRALEVRGVDGDGEEVRVRWAGGGAGSAATALKRHFGARLPSQQITAIALEPFTDDAGLAGEYEILAAHRAGLLRGCDEGRRSVCPDDPVTYGDAAVALAQAEQGVTDGRQDVAAALAAFDREAALDRASERGWFLACAGDCEGESLSRAEAATTLARALGLGSAAAGYADTAGHEAAGAIGAVTAAGLLGPCAEGAFCPDDALTRHDLAVALARAFDLP